MDDPTALEPLVVSLQEAERITGHGKTRLYEELAKGNIIAKKSGTRTLIIFDSLRNTSKRSQMKEGAGVLVVLFGVRRRTMAKVKNLPTAARTIQHMMCTSFWHPDGTPMSAEQFMELLFGKLPGFFNNEAELRTIWSNPHTRKKLLQGLAEKGFGRDQLAEMQKIIDAEKSDLFDVLAYVAYAMPT